MFTPRRLLSARLLQAKVPEIPRFCGEAKYIASSRFQRGAPLQDSVQNQDSFIVKDGQCCLVPGHVLLGCGQKCLGMGYATWMRMGQVSKSEADLSMKGTEVSSGETETSSSGTLVQKRDNPPKSTSSNRLARVMLL
jgi:hypothetical protein